MIREPRIYEAVLESLAKMIKQWYNLQGVSSPKRGEGINITNLNTQKNVIQTFTIGQVRVTGEWSGRRASI